VPSPSIVVQLTPAESRLIHPGLALIAANLKLWRDNGELPFANPDLRTGSCIPGRFDPAFGQLIAKLADQIALARHHRSRVGLTVFDYAVCALAVRTTSRWIVHGHLRPWRRDHTRAAKRLLRKLENGRKKAKRRFIAEYGHSTFSSASRLWRQMLTFIRTHFLSCRCGTRVWAPGLRRYLRNIVAEYCAIARVGLKESGVTPPPDAELHRLARLALAYIRRGRTDFGVKTLLDYPRFGSGFLAQFIVARRSVSHHVEGLGCTK
jgi:hypothetical protein